MENISKPLFALAIRSAQALEDIFVPPRCLHCGDHRFARLPLCRACVSALGGSPGKVQSTDSSADADIPKVHALFAMTPPLQTLIHGLKYRRTRRLAGFLCGHVRRRSDLLAVFENADALVPVPMHSSRRRERGYNQAEVLAKEVGKRCGRPVIAGALRRIRPTASQTKLGQEERKTNLSGVFQSNAKAVRGRKILLVDDVCTTGSTLSHCRTELLRAGAASVDAFVVAWVRRRDGGSGG